MSKRIAKDDQKVICRKYLTEYLKENNREIDVLTIKDVDSMNIDKVSRLVKREILEEMKVASDIGSIRQLKKWVGSLAFDMDTFFMLYNFSKTEVDFIHELFNQKEKLYNLIDVTREVRLKRDNDEEVVLIKEKLTDIDKLSDQTPVSVKINKDIYQKMREYGRMLGGMSVREMIHIGMKDLLNKIEKSV